MVVRFGTNINRNQLMLWSPRFRLATIYQVWSWPACGILDNICNKRTEDDADGETENGDVDSMGARLNYNGPEDYQAQGHEDGVDNVPNLGSTIRCLHQEGSWSYRTNRHTLYFCMWVLYG